MSGKALISNLFILDSFEMDLFVTCRKRFCKHFNCIMLRCNRKYFNFLIDIYFWTGSTSEYFGCQTNREIYAQSQ